MELFPKTSCYFRKEYSELKKKKKNTLKKFLIFQEMEVAHPRLKNLFIFQEGTCKALKKTKAFYISL